jgi:hypothetical protein
MDKKYISPEMEIIKFETEDVITASGGGRIPGSQEEFEEEP